MQAESDRNEELATHDALTGLANRTIVERTLDQILTEDTPVAVLLIDLDRFKDVNDTLGHNNGDLLLIEAGRRMGGLVTDNDLIARLGGDEFAVVVRSERSVDGLTRLARRLIEQLRQPYFSSTSKSRSAPASESPCAAGTPQTHRPCCAGPTSPCTPRRKTGPASSITPPSGITTAPSGSPSSVSSAQPSSDQELKMHYQPLVASEPVKSTAPKRSFRWPQPDGSWVYPDEFIPLAEHTGLIRPLSRYVIGEVIRQAARWHRQGLDLVSH